MTPRPGLRLSLTVSLGAFVLLSPGLFWDIPGGKAITGGLRILAGDIPYRDFWTMYAPGQFYLVAALFRVFGSHVWVQGTAVLLVFAAAAGVLFHILRERLELSTRASATVTTVFVLMEWRLAPEVSSYEPLLLCAFLAFNALLRYFQGLGRTNLVWAGVCYGVGAWFKHDVAFYLTAGSAIALLLGWVFAGRVRPAGWIGPVEAIGRLAATSAAVVLPVIALLAWKAGPDAWEDLVRFPAQDFQIVRGEPYPPLVPPWVGLLNWIGDPASAERAFRGLNPMGPWILGNMPQLVFVGGVGWLLMRGRRLSAPTRAAALLFLSCMPFFWAAAHVQQNTHPYTMAILSLLLGSLVWTSIRATSSSRRSRGWLLAAFCLYTLGLMVRPAMAAARLSYFWSATRPTTMPIVRGLRVPNATLDVYEPIVAFVREHVPPGESIYVGVARHDAIVISNQIFYALTERKSATRFNELHPGLADNPRYQQEMIDDIEARGVRCVILWRFGWGPRVLDQIRDRRRARLPQLGATALDDYLRREFEVVERHGEYDVMWRRDMPRGAASGTTR